MWPKNSRDGETCVTTGEGCGLSACAEDGAAYDDLTLFFVPWVLLGLGTAILAGIVVVQHI